MNATIERQITVMAARGWLTNRRLRRSVDMCLHVRSTQPPSEGNER